MFENMIWKVVILLIVIGLLFGAFYIVYQNRSSENLVSNFFVVIVLGSLSVFATSLLSLKNETVVDNYSACMLLQKNPLFLMNYGVRIKINRTVPFVFTNNSIQHATQNGFDSKTIFIGKNSENRKIIHALFSRYIFDLLASKFPGHWYIRSFSYKTPNGIGQTSLPIENLKSKILNDSELMKIFPDNIFLKAGFYNDVKDSSKKHPYRINIPPDTKISFTHDATYSISELKFENDFSIINFKYRSAFGEGEPNEKICHAYGIDKADTSNYEFLPFLIETKIVFKKYRSGNPDMEKYKYWANDLLNSLKNNISIDEFWNQVEMNQ